MVVMEVMVVVLVVIASVVVVLAAIKLLGWDGGFDTLVLAG